MFAEQEKCFRKRKAKELGFQRHRCNSFHRWGNTEEKRQKYIIKGETALEQVLSQEWKTEGRQ